STRDRVLAWTATQAGAVARATPTTTAAATSCATAAYWWRTARETAAATRRSPSVATAWQNASRRLRIHVGDGCDARLVRLTRCIADSVVQLHREDSEATFEGFIAIAVITSDRR